MAIPLEPRCSWPQLAGPVLPELRGREAPIDRDTFGRRHRFSLGEQDLPKKKLLITLKKDLKKSLT